MFLAMFIGNLAADASIMQGNSSRYCSFRAASNKNIINQQTGQVTTYTTWVTVNINAGYDGVLPYLRKGTKVFVMGYLTHNIYRDKAGMNQIGITMSAMRIELCGDPKPQMTTGNYPQGQPQGQPQARTQGQPQAQPQTQPQARPQAQPGTYPQPTPMQQPFPQVPYNPTPEELEFAKQWGQSPMPF